MSPTGNSKVMVQHLQRKAVVYLRQSSEFQVRHNRESQKLQYAMADQARRYGFGEVEVIDCDLGQSAAVGARRRDGFERLLALVAMGQVGMVLSREASRLSRSDQDWCRLLEVCQVFDTLISDAEQVYDLRRTDDQLVLGIKGTLSVVELSTLKMRLVQGQESKAARGELIRILPPGYVKGGDPGEVVKDPDLRVQQAVALVLSQFRKLGSIRQTHRWFGDSGIELPVNRCRGGRRRIVWKLPTMSFVSAMLHNAFYAGAYVYGRRSTEVRVVDGRAVRRQGSACSPQQARVFIREHHEGYIDWATYEDNQRIIRGNTLNQQHDESVTAVRAGHGLLTGLLRCRRCGRKLHVRYWGKSGTAARYLCSGDYANGGSYCLGFGGATVDKRISQEVIAVISPMGVHASLEAQRRLQQADSAQARALGKQLEQAQYEALRAREQYDAVDPRNRLVATELERRWEAAMGRVEQLKAEVEQLAQQRPELTAEQRQRLEGLGQRVDELWHQDACPMKLKKRIVRAVLQEVLVDLDQQTDTLHFVLHWKGGCHTELQMPKPPSGVGRKTDAGDLELIREMAGRGYADATIARVLTKLGRRTGAGKRWSQQRVASARKRGRIPGQSRDALPPDILSLGQVVKQYGVSDTTVRKLVRHGLLTMDQAAPWAPWEIQRSQLEAEPVRGVLQRLRETGKLELNTITSPAQTTLFE